MYFLKVFQNDTDICGPPYKCVYSSVKQKRGLFGLQIDMYYDI